MAMQVRKIRAGRKVIAQGLVVVLFHNFAALQLNTVLSRV